MQRKTLVVSACAAAMFLMLNVGKASAQFDPLDSRTEFTVSAPVTLPGVTLPAGTYVFRIPDMNRRVTQVLSKDGSKAFGTFMTITTERPTAADEGALSLYESPAGTAPAVKAWWYAARKTGREFIYPKDQARRIAVVSHTNVLTTKSDNVPTEKMAAAELTYVTPTGQEVEAANQTAAAVADTPNSPAPPTTMDRAPVQESQTAVNMPRQTLPRTNGLLPLFALIGVTSLVGGAALSFRR